MTGAQLWEQCALEGEAVATQGAVRFGWDMRWVEAQLRSGASCTPETFGADPVPGIRKVCECSSSNAEDGSQLRDDMGVQWKRCAKEGSKCSCAANASRRFGRDEQWVVAEPESAAPDAPADQVLCSAEGFGSDPAVGKSKECWCETGRQKRPRDRVAIVLLSRRPPDLRRWLQYHLDYMKVDHVFIDVEDSPEFNSTWNSLSPAHQQQITVWMGNPGDGPDKRPKDDYVTLQRRQMQVMAQAKADADKLGIAWLIHIDDDELLYTPMPRPVGEILSFMPRGYAQAYIPNVEAVYPSAEVKNCFTEVKEVVVTRWKFSSYANGKSAVRVREPVVPAGPHMWHTAQGNQEPRSIHLDKEPFGAPLLVVHFESCPFARWEEKYWELGKTSTKEVEAIPFPFYRESIRAMQHCRVVGQDGVAQLLQAPECSRASLQRLWSHWKTRANPNLGEEDVMPVKFSWDKVMAALG